MAAHRYWRLTGFCVNGTGALELSEVRLYAGGVPADTTATLTCPLAPVTGALADLKNGLATGVVSWPFSVHSSPGFSLNWDFGVSGADVDALRLGSGNSKDTYPVDVTAQWSDDSLQWTTHVSVVSVKYPGALTLTTEPIAAADPNYGSVSLLLHCDGANGSTTFTDNSSSPRSVTAAGDAKISTAQSKFGGASLLLNGTTGYVSTPDSTDFSFGAGDYTVEAWIRTAASVTSTQLICGQWGSSALSWNLGVGNGNTLLLESSTDGTYQSARDLVSAASIVPIATWVHVAMTRSGDVYTLWRDGSSVGTLTIAGTLFDSSNQVTVGAGTGTQQYFNGNIDDLRITKGIARYTATFTPPAELPNSSGGDTNFDKVSLLLHGDGANGSTAVTDSSPQPNTVTANGAAQIRTAQSKFGGSSLFLGATNASYASIQNAAAFDLASQDFTIEGWLYLVATGTAGGSLIGRWGVGPSTNTDFILALVGGKLIFNVGLGGVALNDPASFPTNAWTHVAATRNGNVWTMWKGGVSVASQTLALAVPYSAAQAIRLGVWDDPNSSIDGYMDDVRVTKGLARYTAAFTPPTSPFGGAPYSFLPVDSPAPKRWRAPAAQPVVFKGSALPDVGYVSGPPRVVSFSDVYHGGWGIVYGTVKEKNAPANTPWRRRVLLIDEASRMTIRETWSDAVTGNYEFRGVKEGVKYTVLSYDHTGTYRAVVADAQVPELMA